jgi:hypothetical protein
MTAPAPDRLYELLPALYREKDAGEGHQLRALLRIVAEQAGALEADVEGLWNDLFIETCREWVVPYIGDLVDNDPIYDQGRIAAGDTAAVLFPDLAGPDLRPPVAVRSRADVAKTIYYRRRKGTLPMLEELARDVTGWAAHAVEFLERLGWTQNAEHVRPGAAWLDLRSVERCERVNGAFDESSHTVDVRPISTDEGWHAVPNVGFFLWRLGAFPLADVPARRAGAAWRYHFSPLGNRAPLFSHWRPEGDEAGLAGEIHVPGPIRRSFLAPDLERHRTGSPPPAHTDLYGIFEAVPGSDVAPSTERSLAVVRNGIPVEPAAVVCCRLDPWPTAAPPGRVVAIDADSGRLAIGDGWGDATKRVDAHYHYGFPAELGGGPYERRKWLIRPEPERPVRRYRVKQDGVVAPGAAPATHTDLAAALAAWEADGGGDAIVSILDSRTYEMPGSVSLEAGYQLAIEAANGQRPLLLAAGGLAIVAPPQPAGPRPTALTLSGVVLEGHLHVTGDLGRVRLIHSTLLPGRAFDAEGRAVSAEPSLIVEGASGGAPINRRLRVEAAFAILGPLSLPEDAEAVCLRDTIVDGLGGRAIAAAPLDLERTTVLGSVRTRSLEASETIFAAPVEALRRQAGCVRFSVVPGGSLVPRRSRCTSARPSFVSTAYGSPAYAQLRASSPAAIRSGAADGAEIGAYAHLKQPQRESNLRLRLGEYLPFGREPGLVYVT